MPWSTIGDAFMAAINWPNVAGAYEALQSQPIARLPLRIDIGGSAGAIIHVIRMLVHVEREDWLSAGQGRHMHL